MQSIKKNVSQSTAVIPVAGAVPVARTTHCFLSHCSPLPVPRDDNPKKTAAFLEALLARSSLVDPACPPIRRPAALCQPSDSVDPDDSPTAAHASILPKICTIMEHGSIRLICKL